MQATSLRLYLSAVMIGIHGKVLRSCVYSTPYNNNYYIPVHIIINFFSKSKIVPTFIEQQETSGEITQVYARCLNRDALYLRERTCAQGMLDLPVISYNIIIIPSSNLLFVVVRELWCNP